MKSRIVLLVAVCRQLNWAIRCGRRFGFRHEANFGSCDNRLTRHLRDDSLSKHHPFLVLCDLVPNVRQSEGHKDWSSSRGPGCGEHVWNLQLDSFSKTSALLARSCSMPCTTL